MSIINFTGFEQGNTRSVEGSDDYQPPTSGASVQSSVAKNGTYSMEFAKVTTATPYVAFPFNFDSDGKANVNNNNRGTIYFTGYFRYASKPSSGDDVIISMLGADPIAELRLKSDGKLVLYDFNNYGTPVLLATSTTALSQDTWYRIGLKIVAGASGSYELKIDGASEFSGSRSWVITGDLGKAHVGNRTDRNSQSFTFYWDDIVADDSTYIDVDYAVKVIKPVADGSTQTWTNGTGASNYTQIDEIPIDDADYIMSPTSGNPNTALFTYQSRAVAGIDNGDIFAIKHVLIGRENTSTGTTQTYSRVVSGATTSDAGQINLTTSTQGFNKFHLVDPNTGSAWTGSALDAIEAGVRENNGKATRVISSLIYVLYEVNTEVTTTQDITGKSRIQKAVLATINGLARITGITTKTIQGVGNIRATTLRTITGLSRIQKSVSQTITGLARITKVVTATITGLSRITASTQRTIDGKARITATTLRTQTGVSRIQKSVSQTIQGLSRIQKAVTENITGLSRIQKSVSQTIDGVSRITAITLKTITGLSNIRATTTKTIDGKARIEKSVTQDIQGTGRVIVSHDRDIQGVGNIRATTIRTITGISRLQGTSTQNETGVARIQKSATRTINGTARVQKSETKTLLGVSRITATVQENITGKGSITAGTEQNIQGKASILQIAIRTQTGTSRIQKAVNQTETGVSRILKTILKTITGKSRIQKVVGKTITGKARILPPRINPYTKKASPYTKKNSPYTKFPN